MKKAFKQGALTMPPPAKNTIIVFFVIIFFNVLAPMAKAQTLTLTPSNFNGTNISCFGAQDGSINLTITGVTPPYTIRWSNDATTEDLSNVPAGYYHVEVDDTIPTTDIFEAEITLTEPEHLAIDITASDFLVNGRHYNISLNGACNGSITSTVTGGVAPYLYNWEPYGQTTASLSNICPGDYNLSLIDANGCSEPAQQAITEPDRDDWQMTGNTGTNPSTQFIGTLDNQDFSLRTYNQERLRIKANGDIKINSLLGGVGMVYVDDNGVLQNSKNIAPCTVNPVPPIWSGTTGTAPFIWSCPQLNVVIGSLTAPPTLIKFRVQGNTAFDGKMHVGMYNAAKPNIAAFEVCEGINKTAIGCLAPNATNDWGNTYIGWNAARDKASGNWTVDNNSASNGGAVIYTTVSGKMRFINIRDNGTGQSQILNDAQVMLNTKMIINEDGLVGIGTDPQTNYRLVVEGKIGAREVRVAATGPWPDYAFAKNHKIKTLSQISDFTKTYKRLPGYQSAAEVEKNGINLGEQVQLHQLSIEEIYLYLFELKKENEELKVAIKNINKKLSRKSK